MLLVRSRFRALFVRDIAADVLDNTTSPPVHGRIRCTDGVLGCQETQAVQERVRNCVSEKESYDSFPLLNEEPCFAFGSRHEGAGCIYVLSVEFGLARLYLESL